MTPSDKTSPDPKNHDDLVVLFLAEVMRATIDAESQDAFQQALQTYCDSLLPWLTPSDGPTHPRATFSLLDDCSFDATGKQVSVVLSPEAEALFKAWLRRNQIWDDAGLSTAHAWSN